MKPAAIPPKKPAPSWLANIPPIKPGAKPGRSAIEKAIKPANTGIINAKAAPPPISIKVAAIVPFSLNASIPNTNESAINKPPAMTTGNICETPVIRCLYTPFSSSF